MKKPYATRCHVRLYEVERRRIELPTCTLRTYRSPKLSYRPDSLFLSALESTQMIISILGRLVKRGRPSQTCQIPILPTSFLLTCCRTFVTFLPSSNSKEWCMRFLAFTVVVASVLLASGCRHDYNPTPPAYYCQPACGCTPACNSNPCAPSATPYLSPTPNAIPRPGPYASAPASPYGSAPASTYASGPASPTYTPPPAGSYPAPSGSGTYAPSGSNAYAPGR